MIRQPCVYILASRKYGVLYVGVTSEIVKRIWEHKQGVARGFTQKYHVHRLVYFEQIPDMVTAIGREKQLKKWNRQWKVDLIEKNNPQWADLYSEIVG